MTLSINDPVQRKWWILVAMSLSLGITYIDQTGISVALPKIQQAFNLRPVSLQWIINAYLLTLAVFLIVGGRLGDIFEHHRVFMAGIIIFLTSSIACALAPSIHFLIGSRIFQGLGAALTLPNSSVIIIKTFGAHEKGRAMGIYVSSALLFSPLALMLGGIFTEFFSWRLIFWINLPICLLCLWITSKVVESSPVQPKPFDWAGAVTSILAGSSLVVALMQSSKWGWHSPLIIILLASFIVFSIACYYIEKKPNAIIDITLFHNKLFICAVLLLFAISVSMAFFVFDAIFYQEILGYTPLQTAFLFFPNIACVALTAPLAGRSLDKFGYKRPVTWGLIFFISGLLLKAIIVPFQNYWFLLPGIILMSIGSAFIISPINTATLSSIDHKKRGSASGILNAVRQISNSITLAVLILIIAGINTRILQNFILLNNKLYPTLTSLQLEALLHNHVVSSEENLANLIKVAKNSFAQAYSISFYISALFVFIVLIVVLILFNKIRREYVKPESDYEANL